jgi:hypothetical protein
MASPYNGNMFRWDQHASGAAELLLPSVKEYDNVAQGHFVAAPSSYRPPIYNPSPPSPPSPPPPSPPLSPLPQNQTISSYLTLSTALPISTLSTLSTAPTAAPLRMNGVDGSGGGSGGEGKGWAGTDVGWVLDQVCNIWSLIKTQHGKVQHGSLNEALTLPLFQNDLSAIHATLLQTASQLNLSSQLQPRVDHGGYIPLSEITMDDFWELNHAQRLVFMKVCPKADCADPTCVRIHGEWDPNQANEFELAAKMGDGGKGGLACRDQLLDLACYRENCGYRHFARLRDPITHPQILALLYSYWNRPGRTRPVQPTGGRVMAAKKNRWPNSYAPRSSHTTSTEAATGGTNSRVRRIKLDYTDNLSPSTPSSSSPFLPFTMRHNSTTYASAATSTASTASVSSMPSANTSKTFGGKPYHWKNGMRTKF